MSIKFFIYICWLEVSPIPLRIPYVSFVKECPIIFEFVKQFCITSAIFLLFDLKPSKMYIFFPVEIWMIAASSTFSNLVCPTMDSVSIPNISASSMSLNT